MTIATVRAFTFVGPLQNFCIKTCRGAKHTHLSPETSVVPESLWNKNACTMSWRH
ncbi:hypothetical protein TRP66_07850 [Pseudomonas sp. JDS28PS106]|uniref:hypothetical protein n=1 Tax=Pseudomonas sp. JDS28PS106 TaxID=2497235 RepID=UPI002FD50B70